MLLTISMMHVFGWLVQDFTKIVVAGDPPPVVKPKKTAVKKPLDAHLPAAKLRLFCFDRTTGGSKARQGRHRQPVVMGT